MSPQPPPQWGPAPERPQDRRGWFARHRLLTVLLAVTTGLVILGVLGSLGGQDSTAPPPATKAKAKAVTDSGRLPGVGEPARDGKFEFTVTRLQPGVGHIGGAYGQDAQGQFYLVHMTVKNIGDRARTFDGADQKLIDRNGSKYSADTAAAIHLDGSDSFLQQINPGNAVDGIVVFDVPKNADPVRIELHDSLFSGGTTVDLTRRR
ncbi:MULTISPECIES: DUF4352 domain-containing protein [Streptomyces]|uniref:Mpr protein n=1 Tax=Streptomyces spororaveus TaxID=284039 RepID=A0ABQ3TIU9_9ACTN|nr:DUF4352 domain-containing protein [Streptomyces spororaveus]MCM9079346.1 DUF4352 domain-containing protein [Streptomyces spororaveus]GHI80331.1 Mpr protein [Streptomyces spororaveus]